MTESVAVAGSKERLETATGQNDDDGAQSEMIQRMIRVPRTCSVTGGILCAALACSG